MNRITRLFIRPTLGYVHGLQSRHFYNGVSVQSTRSIHSWSSGYSEESIMARVNRPKSRNPGKLASKPGLTEEDMWLKAAAPGYTVDRSHTPTEEQKKQWKPHPAWPSDSATSSLSSTEWIYRTTSGIVRESEVQVISESAIDNLIHDYNETVMPMYKSLSGCRFAQLWIDKDTLTARSITGWESEAQMRLAGNEPQYAKAMQKIASHFSSPPSLKTYQLVADGTAA